MTKSDKTGFEIPDQMREMADKSVDQARKAFDEYMNATRKAVGSVETTASTVKAGADDLSRTALEYTEEHISAAFDLASVRARVALSAGGAPHRHRRWRVGLAHSACLQWR